MLSIYIHTLHVNCPVYICMCACGMMCMGHNNKYNYVLSIIYTSLHTITITIYYWVGIEGGKVRQNVPCVGRSVRM